jgi:glycosyltransferase involved in cell wall biosynthesis
MLYARVLFATWPDDCAGLLVTPWGPRLFHRRRVLRFLDALDSLWCERQAAADNGCYSTVDHIEEGTENWQTAWRGTAMATMLGLGSLLGRTGVAAGTPLSRAATGATYLNTGQGGWLGQWLTRWLQHRPDIRPVFMLHDAAPLHRPDLVTPRDGWKPRRIVKLAAEHTGGLIFNTRSACRLATHYLDLWYPPTLGHVTPLTTAIPLPVTSRFMAPELFSQPQRRIYFIAVGAIEPSKNYALLLHVWQELLRRRGTRTPGLVIVGAASASSADVLDELRARPHLYDYIKVCSRLSPSALCRLVAEARALLVPALAACRGLTIAESLTTGTPVLASDLSAHREAGGDYAVYLDAADPAGWLREVAAFADGEMAALRRRIAHYQPVTEDVYFTHVTGFLQAVTDRSQSARDESAAALPARPVTAAEPVSL